MVARSGGYIIIARMPQFSVWPMEHAKNVRFQGELRTVNSSLETTLLILAEEKVGASVAVYYKRVLLK